ncbi:MAG: DNA replication and repair protein RecF [Gaiellales bacterium]
MRLRNVRSYGTLDLGFEAGLVLVTGRNGTGKTNLVEAIHVATQGFSFRTRMDSQLIRTGETEAYDRVEGSRGGVPFTAEARLSLRAPKKLSLNGAAVASTEELRHRLHVLVFTPDRLGVAKGGPAVRRAYFDRVLARVLPARADAPTAYGAALGQRNAALRRVAAGVSPRDVVEPWTETLVACAETLVAARAEAIRIIAPAFAACAGELGLPEATIRYDAEPPTTVELSARLERDLERGSTGLGPHLDELLLLSGDRDLRAFGSQGEQRLTVLSLLLAEAEVLTDFGGVPPLLLLDDALSELDADRRRILSARLGRVGQAIVTAAGAEALPLAPAQLFDVVPGTVTVR